MSLLPTSSRTLGMTCGLVITEETDTVSHCFSYISVLLLPRDSFILFVGVLLQSPTLQDVITRPWILMMAPAPSGTSLGTKWRHEMCLLSFLSSRRRPEPLVLLGLDTVKAPFKCLPLLPRAIQRKNKLLR